MKIKVYLLNAFTINKKGGNPAGVVLNTDKLNNKYKKIIAKKVGFSETVFVEQSTKANFKLRFFTPNSEIDFCGHATIAAYYLLLQKKYIKAGSYHQELKAGLLEIKVSKNGLVVMQQPLPQFAEIINSEEIKRIFNKNLTINNLKAQIVFTGLRDIILPVETRALLFSLRPNFKKMMTLNKQTNSIGIHAFSLDTINLNSIACCRNFAPLYGINEESATGSANGAL